MATKAYQPGIFNSVHAVMKWQGWAVVCLIGLFTHTCFTAKAQPTAAFTADITSGCSPLIVQFTDASTGSPVDWQWDFGNGNTSTDQNPGAIFVHPGVYNISLIVTDGQGAKDSLTVAAMITVLGSPTPALEGDVNTGCVPLTVNFQDLSVPLSSGITNWLWEFGDGTISTAQHPTHTYTLPGNFTVYLKVTDGNGCEGAVFLNNYIQAFQPKANFQMPANVCPIPATINFTNTTTGSGLAYVWDFGDGTTSTATDPSHTYTIGGIYNVSLIATDNKGCKDTMIKPLDVATFKADFGITYTASDCSSQFLVQFDDSSDAGAKSWAWDFGDGDGSGVQSPDHEYIGFGSYNVTLIAGLGSGCADTITKVVSYTPPQATFSVDSSFNCEVPWSVTFDNQSTGESPLQFTWDLMDSSFTTFDTSSFTYTFQREDSFMVELEVLDFLSCRDTLVDTLLVRFPEAGFTSSVRDGCVPLTITFADTSTSLDPITQWDWDLGDGATSTLKNPMHTYVDTGQYTVSLVVTTALGCQDTLVRTNFIEAGLKPDTVGFTHLPNDTICYQDTIRFEALPGFNDPNIQLNNWLWDLYSDIFPSQFTVGDTSMVTWAFEETYAGPDSAYPGQAVKSFFTGLDTVMLIAGHYGCNDTAKQQIFISVPVALDGFTGPQAACEAPYTLGMFNASYGYTNYLGWEIRDAEADVVLLTGTSDTVTYTFTDDGQYEFRVTVENDTLFNNTTTCVSTVVHPLVIDSAVASFDVTPSVGCLSDNRFQFDNTTFTKYGSLRAWTWDFGDGDTLVKTDKIKADSTVIKKFSHNGKTGGTYDQPVHIYTDSGTYTITLTAIVNVAAGEGASLLCVYNVTQDVYVQHIQNGFMVDRVSACPGTVVNFTDTSSSSGTITSWQWDFGDGNTASGQQVAHTYNASGKYDVSLIINDSNGCTDTLVKARYLNITKPLMDFEAAPTTICAGDTVFFNSFVQGDSLTYLWDFGDATSDTLDDPYHIYSNADSFTVTLAVTDKYGCDSILSKPQLVVVRPSPTAAFVPLNVSEECPPLPVTFTDSSSSDVTVWEWDFGDGQFSAAQHPTHVFTQSGTFDVTLVVSNDAGCTDTVTQPNFVTINGPSQAVTVSADSGCIPQTVTFVAHATNTQFWFWDLGDGTLLDGLTASQSGDSVIHTYTSPGLYHPNLVLISPSNCQLSVAAFDTIFIDSVQAGFALGGNVFCAVDTIPILDTSYSFHSSQVFWDFGDGQLDTGNVMGHFYDQPGNYTITQTLVSTIDPACTDVATIPISINEEPDIVLDPLDTIGCIPALYNFGAISNSPSVTINGWQWDFGDGDSVATQTASHTYQSPGSVTVTLSVSYGGDGCVLEVPVTLGLYDYPMANFDFSPEDPTMEKPEVQFNDLSTDPATWLWEFGNGDTALQQHPSYSFSAPGEYNISLIIANEAGCMDTAIQALFVYPDVLLTLPNAFTPNQDGFNDTYYLFHAGIEELIFFRVFNRWGELLFETQDINVGWDGTFRGKAQDSDTYVYYVLARGVNGKEVERKGNFTLIR